MYIRYFPVHWSEEENNLRWQKIGNLPPSEV